MRLLRLLFLPFTLLLRLIARPFQLFARRRAAGKSGWLELELEGPVIDVYAPPPMSFIRRFLPSREEPPKVVLAQTSRLVNEIVADGAVQGVLIRLGGLGGGWAAAARLRGLLAKVRAANKRLIVHVKHGAGNREYFVATAGEKIWTLPSAMLIPVGTAASTLFLKDALSKAGVKVEVAAAGKYKSAADAMTRNDRSETDREQTTSLVNAMDGALLDAISEGRSMPRDQAAAMVDAAPLTGARALEARMVDALVRDEDLPGAIDPKDPIDPVPAQEYFRARVLKPILPVRKRLVAIVEVHGPIMDRGNMYFSYFEKMAIEKAVVADLRVALADRRIAAVVLHVDSRGGSVTASDAIYGAVKRLAAEKPVVACFGDVSASGGYYVACGARAIIASPLTITGSIGVFATLPTWPELTERLEIHQDVIKNRKNAALFDPWRPRSEDERAHAQLEVFAMYDAFLTLVADARKKSKEEIDRVAQGRVWTGDEALANGLVDGLGGLDEALDRARSAAKISLYERPAIVRAKRPMPRPGPVKAPSALIEQLALAGPEGAIALEMLALVAGSPRPGAFAWAPIPLT